MWFGVKVSLATTLHRSRGGQFHRPRQGAARQLYDGHTLATVIPEIETQIGANLTRIVADRGYRGHNAHHTFKVYISGQRRRVTETIKRQLRRRSAVEPVIGHAKSEHRMAGTISPAPTATPQTPSLPPPLHLPPAPRLAGRFGAPSSRRSSPPPGTLPYPRNTALGVHRNPPPR